MPVLEASIENYLVKQVALHTGQAMKIEKRRHWPDRLVVLPVREYIDPFNAYTKGGLHLVETKKPKNGRLSAGQKLLHEQLALIGIKVHVIYTKAQVDAFIKENTING